MGLKSWNSYLEVVSQGSQQSPGAGMGVSVILKCPIRGPRPARARPQRREHRRTHQGAFGLHIGEAIKEGEDFFGKSVILAARIASQALGGQILVSSREVRLKGLVGTHEVFGVRW